MPLGNNAEATVQIPAQTNSGRIGSQNSEPTVLANSIQPPKKSRTGLIVGLLAISLLAIVAVIGAVGAYFALSGKKDVAAVSPTPTATPVSANLSNNSNSADNSGASTKELEEKLKRLEKQLEDQKKANQKSSSSSQTPLQNSYATAKVNSPNDGFLALRSEPSTENGAQLLKIPHGATVVLNNCEKNTIKVSGRSGRWCDVEYKGQGGWVFSAWLDY